MKKAKKQKISTKIKSMHLSVTGKSHSFWHVTMTSLYGRVLRVNRQFSLIIMFVLEELGNFANALAPPFSEEHPITVSKVLWVSDKLKLYPCFLSGTQVSLRKETMSSIGLKWFQLKIKETLNGKSHLVIFFK